MFKSFEGSFLANKCRDISLFQYYSGGLRISDVLQLKVKDTHGDKLNIKVKKTGAQISNKLNKPALEIINIYREGKNIEDFIFDFLTNDLKPDDIFGIDKQVSISTALINKCLKQIMTKLEIPKSISTHSFRHSFAINALQKGIRIEEVQKILKHSNLRETMIYVQIQNEQVDKALELFGK